MVVLACGAQLSVGYRRYFSHVWPSSEKGQLYCRLVIKEVLAMFDQVEKRDNFIWLKNSLGFLRFSYGLSKRSFVKNSYIFNFSFFATVFVQNSYFFSLFLNFGIPMVQKSLYSSCTGSSSREKKRHISTIELPRRPGWWGADTLPYATRVASCFAFLGPCPRASQAPWSSKGNSS
jgi:hypothetical protein